MLLRHLLPALALAIGIGGTAQASPTTPVLDVDKVQTAYAHYRPYAHRHVRNRRVYYHRPYRYRRPVRVVRYYRPHRHGYYRPARVVRYSYPAYRRVYHHPYRYGYYGRPYGYGYYPRSGVSISIGF